MAGVGQVLFFCMFIVQDRVKVHKHDKRELQCRLISSHLDQTSLANKRFTGLKIATHWSPMRPKLEHW